MKRNLLLIIFILFWAILFDPRTVNTAGEVNIYFFWGVGCPHCAKEKETLEFYKHKYPYINVIDLEVTGNYDNAKKLIESAKILDVGVDGVPFTIIGDKYFVGYSEMITASQISERIEYCHNYQCPDSLSKIFISENGQKSFEPPIIYADTTTSHSILSNSDTNLDPKNPIQFKADVIVNKENIESKQIIKKNNIIKLPFLGEVDALHVSLPLITVLMGVLDGFNPCAMWVLVFLISLLLGMQNKRRMWFLGSTFIIASSFVYFLFMSAWLNLVLFIGFVFWIRLLVGMVALIGGAHNLRDYYSNREGCQVTQSESRKKIFNKLKEISQQHRLSLAFIGILVLAFAVNLVELVCSAGLPAVYTQILALNNLSGGEYYLYILLYILFFMLDDLAIFIIAMSTLRLTGFSNRYSRYSKLVGGLVMVIIALLLFFKPEWLMFG